jgi:PAS domain S-box-containing protein
MVAAALLFLPGWGRAMQDPPTFRHLTIADGLSQNAVSAILQDHRGFMWFGTKDGLNRYDGYDFVVHRHDPADPTSLANSDVSALFLDRAGQLWVGTRSGGLDRFDRDREIFRHVAGLGAPVTAITQDQEGDLWVATFGAGLVRLSWRERGRSGATVRTQDAEPRLQRFNNDPGDPRSLSHDRVHAVLVDRSGTLWVGSRGGLDRLDPGGTGFTRYRVEEGSATGLIDEAILSLREDREGRLWMGSTPGISVFDRDRERITHHHHRYRTFRYGWGEVRQILEDRNGVLWLSTASELMQFDPAAEDFTYLARDPQSPRGLSSNLPTALHQDRSGVIWIGTNGFGLNIHDTKGTRFRTFVRPETRSYRHPTFSVYTLFEDSDSAVWIGAEFLYRWDRSTGSFTSFETTPDRPEDFGNSGVWALLEHPRGFLWAGTYAGLFHYEIATGRARQYRHDPDDPEGLPETEVKDVFRDPEGTIWVVTANHIAELVDPAAGRFRSHLYHSPTTDAWTFPSLTRTGDGLFWFGSLQGLVRFDPSTRTFGHYRNAPGDPTTLGNDVVRSILPDPRDPERILWVGTAGGGLNRFDRGTERFTRYTTADGLPNDVVYGILPDHDGRLWLSTNRGLSRFDPATGKFRNFDSKDGLQSDEFNSGAYFRSPSGELFFGGLFGFNHFRPEAVRDNPHVPPVVITGFRRVDRLESPVDANSVLERSITETTSVRLSHQDNIFSFQFAALDYSAPGKNRYAYRMLGFSDRWVEAGSSRSATYMNLPPGSYTFQVRGSNNDGVWNEEGASVALTILPPWWRSWWSYLVYVLILGGLLLAVRRYEMGGIQIRHAVERARAQAFENVFDAVVVTDLDGNIADWNTGSERLYGYSREEAIGQHVGMLHVPEDSEHLADVVIQQVQRDGRWLGEIRMLHKNGRIGWIESMVVPLFDDAGKPVGALGINRDISPRVEAEAKLRKLDQDRRRFFANVTHEFRTPLTLTLGPLDDLRTGFHGELPSMVTQQVELAHRNAGRVMELIDQLLEVARLEAGSTPLRARRLELVAFVRRVVVGFQPLADRRSLGLEMELPAPTTEVYADPDHLEKVVSNLLSNALRFTPEGGSVVVSVTATATHARIVVRDTGPGIPEHELPRVFDRFFRGEHASGHDQTGTGIGLALAQELAHLHGGSIDVESGVGVGSTFTVSLPLGREHLAPEQIVDDPVVEKRISKVAIPPFRPESSVSAPRDGTDPGTIGEADPGEEQELDGEDVTTVLVVEDNSELRAFVRMHLEPRFRVIEAVDGQEGLAVARLRLPDLVISDVMMPGMDGYELCRILKTDAETDFIPVILLTARATREDRMTGLKKQADVYLTKPFEVEELLTHVDNLLTVRRRLQTRLVADVASARPRKSMSAAPVQADSPDAAFLEEVRVAIEAHMEDENFDVEGLGRRVAHSRSHLHRRLTDLIGESPSDLIRRMRLERAAYLLSARAGSVSRVAYAVGFKSVAHFSNRFRDHFGVRPTAYREAGADRMEASRETTAL